MGEYGRKVKVRITETTKGMGAELPVFERKGRKTRVGYELIEWMIHHGMVRYSDLLHLALFKDFSAFKEANGNKEIVIKLVGKENETRQS